MVWSREREATRPPLSVILPRLYLGAESDVTQDRLASLGISYVLSVSRCSPQPSFLPRSRYLRIPIDDSLWADLLPWIPQALHFIDAAMSSGASVLVHCVAGISRSPALAVAYIMYSLGMDLDHAYRFVKERRPSISPNFNFLGQLQLFQGTLSEKASGGGLLIQQLDNRLPLINGSINSNHTSHSTVCLADSVSSDPAEPKQARTVDLHHTDKTQQRHSYSHGSESRQLSLSGKLQTLDLNLIQTQRPVQMPYEVPALSSCEPVTPTGELTKLQLPAGSASLLEKRKSLTLSLTPLGVCPPTTASSSQQARGTKMSPSAHSRLGEKTKAKSKTHRQVEGTYRKMEGTHRQVEGTHRQVEGTHRKMEGTHRPVEGTHRDPDHGRCSMAEVKEQSPLSPLSFTLSKLLGWGERVLLGGVFVHPVRMGQPALPYRC